MTVIANHSLAMGYIKWSLRRKIKKILFYA